MLSFPLLLAVLLQLQPMQMIREDYDRAGVNTHPYEFRTMPVTQAPKGYEPVYISHYGRHGSRTDWGLGTTPMSLKYWKKQRKRGS